MNTRTFYLTTLTIALAACNSMPDRNTALDQARGRFNTAQSTTQVATLAPDELKRASESLRVAEQAWTNGEPTTKVDHLAYLTSQRVVIAQETASSRAAKAITAGAAAERDKMRLEVRTNEADAAKRAADSANQTADAAKQQLVLAQQSEARKAIELAAADANAQREKERTDRSNARVDDLEMQLKDLNAKKTDRGVVVTLGDVLFNSGKAQLLPDGGRNIVKLADFFKRNPDRTASIEGYTDSVGPAGANVDLSERRASAVMNALVDLGVPPDHLSMRGYGEENPAASNDTATGRQMNRRVEIMFAP